MEGHEQDHIFWFRDYPDMPTFKKKQFKEKNDTRLAIAKKMVEGRETDFVEIFRTYTFSNILLYKVSIEGLMEEQGKAFSDID